MGRHDEPSKPKPELSDDDKARIRVEEEFRAKARAEAEQQAQPPTTPAIAPNSQSFKLQGTTPQQNQAVGSIFTLIAFGLLIWWLFPGLFGGGSGSRTSLLTGSTGSFRYELISTCPADVTYSSSGSNTEQESNVSSGWSKSVDSVDIAAQLIAQIKCNGDVTSRIYRNGELVKEANSSGEYVIAHAVYP